MVRNKNDWVELKVKRHLESIGPYNKLIKKLSGHY